MSIESRAQRLARELGKEAHEHCRASIRFALGIGNMEVAVAMGATAARVAQLQGLTPLETPKGGT